MLKNLYVHIMQSFTISVNSSIELAEIAAVNCYFGKGPNQVATVKISSADEGSPITIIEQSNNTIVEIPYKIIPNVWGTYKPISYRVDIVSTNGITNVDQFGTIFIDSSVIPNSDD